MLQGEFSATFFVSAKKNCPAQYRDKLIISSFSLYCAEPVLLKIKKIEIYVIMRYNQHVIKK
ncbi:hypothetical protein [Megamonas hypermegale]|uniref:hypothetical protein n=1 Tax=Megamonas hypermegale TaxID=158847 RepID=UPI0026EF84CB|nr:hypothetical protein [Megamonas hypermegale]